MIGNTGSIDPVFSYVPQKRIGFVPYGGSRHGQAALAGKTFLPAPTTAVDAGLLKNLSLQKYFRNQREPGIAVAQR